MRRRRTGWPAMSSGELATAIGQRLDDFVLEAAPFPRRGVPMADWLAVRDLGDSGDGLKHHPVEQDVRSVGNP